MMQGALGHWEIVPPPGLTDTGRQKRFYEKTIARLQTKAQEISSRTFAQLQQGVRETYTEGEGTVASSLQYRVQRTPTGISVEFMAGGRHLVFLTALAGEPIASPGHFIPQQGRSRFFWRNPLHGLPPGMYSFTPQKPAFWRTRQGRDVITEVLNTGAQQFAQAMIAENNRALVEFVQNDLRTPSKSPRVNVTAGSGIAPQ